MLLTVLAFLRCLRIDALTGVSDLECWNSNYAYCLGGYHLWAMAIDRAA